MRYSQTLLCSMDRRATAGTYPSRPGNVLYGVSEMKGERQPLQHMTICPQAKVIHFQTAT
jgi:hypothetical protein